jgi:hypothetical protein
MAGGVGPKQNFPTALKAIHFVGGEGWFSIEGSTGMQDGAAGIFTGFVAISFIDEYPYGDVGYFFTVNEHQEFVGYDRTPDAAADEKILMYGPPQDLPKFTKDIVKTVTKDKKPIVVGYINHEFGRFPIKLRGFGWWLHGGETPRTPFQVFFKTTKKAVIHLWVDSIDRPFNVGPTIRVYKKGSIEAVAADGSWLVNEIDIAKNRETDKPIIVISDEKKLVLGTFYRVTVDVGKGKITATAGF